MNVSRVLLAGIAAFRGKFNENHPIPIIYRHTDSHADGSYHHDSVVSIARDAGVNGCSFFFSVYPEKEAGTLVSMSTWLPSQIASKHAFPSFAIGDEIESFNMKAILVETKIVV